MHLTKSLTRLGKIIKDKQLSLSFCCPLESNFPPPLRLQFKKERVQWCGPVLGQVREQGTQVDLVCPFMA